MRGFRLCLALATVAAAAAACRTTAADTGDPAPKCGAWCNVADKDQDCTFCACAACGFCPSGGGHHAAAGSAAKKATSWAVPAADCGLGAQARLSEQWNGGFRFEVTTKTWVSGTRFTFDWGGAVVSVRQAYSADVLSQSGGSSVLALKYTHICV